MLRFYFNFLVNLLLSKKSVPDLIADPIALIRDVRTVVERHRHDAVANALTGEPVLKW